MLERNVRQVLTLYPRIFHACHTRHVRDPRTRRVLSRHQASVLNHLDEHESTSLHGLALHMGVTDSTMSIAVDRLVQGGYIRRGRDPADGRRVHLRLSSAGVRIKEAESVLDPARVRAVLRRLPPRRRAEAVRGLALLASAARLEMKNKVLLGLRPHRRARRGRSMEGGVPHA